MVIEEVKMKMIMTKSRDDGDDCLHGGVYEGWCQVWVNTEVRSLVFAYFLFPLWVRVGASCWLSTRRDGKAESTRKSKQREREGATRIHQEKGTMKNKTKSEQLNKRNK